MKNIRNKLQGVVLPLPSPPHPTPHYRLAGQESTITRPTRAQEDNVDPGEAGVEQSQDDSRFPPDPLLSSSLLFSASPPLPFPSTDCQQQRKSLPLDVSSFNAHHLTVTKRIQRKQHRTSGRGRSSWRRRSSRRKKLLEEEEL
eukprot:757895-Hanusia_phi.AAC.3